jgi:hypothetical protein
MCFQLYTDDGATFDYKSGAYLRRNFTWKSEGQFAASLTNSNADKTGRLTSDLRIERIVAMGLDFYPNDVHMFVDGSCVLLSCSVVLFYFEPFHFPHIRCSCRLHTKHC